MTLAKYCFEKGCSVQRVMYETGVSRQTLQNWLIYKPHLLKVVVLGVVAIKKNEAEQEGESE